MKKLPLLYFFPHSYLRHQILELWDKTEQAFTQTEEAIKGALREKFENFREDPKNILINKDVKLTDSDFDTSFIELEDGKKLTVIKFPTPRDATEVTYVGILNGRKPRYFTFELMLSVEPDKKNGYVLCEWTKDGHKEYERSDESSFDIFVEMVKEVLTT